MYCIFGHFTKQIGDVVTGPNAQYFQGRSEDEVDESV